MTKGLFDEALDLAIDHGWRMQFETHRDSFFGVPLKRDATHVQVLIIQEPPEIGTNQYSRTLWILALAYVEAVALQTQYLTPSDFQKLLASRRASDRS